MANNSTTPNRPNLPRHLFWEFRYDQLNWQAAYRTVIARVLERGTKQDWEEMILFYSKAKVICCLKNEIKFIADYAIEDICNYFALRKEELLCYERQKHRKGQWI